MPGWMVGRRMFGRSRSFARGLIAVAVLISGASVLTGCQSAAGAETSQSSAAGSSTTTSKPAEEGSIFDSSRVHQITVWFVQEDYDAMIEAYESSGEKTWIAATVDIDGKIYTEVGMRLKGNSSIMGIRDAARSKGPSAGASAEEPEGLPWLLRLDEYIEGQNHGGIFDLVVRSNTSETSLNEAVALDLLDMAGLASQSAVAVRFSVNGSDAVLRLVTEHPDDMWMDENFGDDGALFKAESTGDYTYRGADPELYEEVFDQEAGKANADLSPLIDFLEFINNADDATFNAELADWLDLDSFATYLAMEELVGNFDDIDGPGNNSYLYYDPRTRGFTIVPWDHNLAFGGLGAGDNRGAEPARQAPGGTQRPAGAGVAPVRPRQGQGGDSAGLKAGGPGKSNILVERFHANPLFEELYTVRLTQLEDQLYKSGAAAEVLTKWVTLLETQASDLVDPATVQSEATAIARYFTAPDREVGS